MLKSNWKTFSRISAQPPSAGTLRSKEPRLFDLSPVSGSRAPKARNNASLGWSEAVSEAEPQEMVKIIDQARSGRCLPGVCARRVLLHDSRAQRLRAFYPGRSDGLHTRWPAYKRLPFFQSGLPTHIRTQGSASLTASLHPGLRSLTPSAYFPDNPLKVHLIAKRSLTL